MTARLQGTWEIFLETHKNIQPVIETKILPKRAKFPHKSIKFVKSTTAECNSNLNHFTYLRQQWLCTSHDIISSKQHWAVYKSIYGAGSTLVNIFQWIGDSKGWGGRLQQFQLAFLQTLIKKFQQACVMWTNSGKTLQALAQWQLDFFSASLDKILYEFLLQSHYHKILHLLSCSIALLTRQSKSTVTIQSEFNGRDAGAQVVPTEAATLSRLVGIRKIHMLTFSIAFYICPCISHLRPNKSHLLYVYHTFLLL